MEIRGQVGTDVEGWTDESKCDYVETAMKNVDQHAVTKKKCEQLDIGMDKDRQGKQL